MKTVQKIHREDSSALPQKVELTRNERRKRETRARLLAATKRVIAQKGFEASTIRNITEEADVGFGSFYNYFDSKDAIVAAAMEDTIMELGNLIDLSNEGCDDPAEVMANAIGNFVRRARLDPLLALFILQVGTLNPRHIQSLTARMARDVKWGVDRGVMNVPSFEVLRAMVSGAVFGFLRERVMGLMPPDADQHAVLYVLRLMGVEESRAVTLSREFKRTPLTPHPRAT